MANRLVIFEKKTLNTNLNSHYFDCGACHFSKKNFQMYFILLQTFD
jgi:hypothetical protein